MSVIETHTQGDFNNIERFLESMYNEKYLKNLDYWGSLGVEALRNATPVDTGLTASSWDYEIVDDGDFVSIQWINRNVNNGVNIAVILQYGHGTNRGGYVQGVDYINPALADVFQKIANDAWLEVVRS